MALSFERWIPFLSAIADRTDPIALRYFRSGDLATRLKADSTPVSDADQEIEDAARALTRREHPELGIRGEERADEPGAGGARLICDPIDGTENFIRGIPIFGTLLAIEEEGEITAGLVSAPAMGLRWRAARGSGAFCGDRRLRVSTIGSIREAQLFHGDLRFVEGTLQPPGLADLLALSRRTRGFGDFYQHLLIAEGAGEIAIDPNVRAWDVAPLQVILEEAGGAATTIEGERDIDGGSLLTSNGRVHPEALRILRGRRGDRL